MKLYPSYSKCKNIIVSLIFPSSLPAVGDTEPRAHSVDGACCRSCFPGRCSAPVGRRGRFLAPAPGHPAPCSAEENQPGVQEEDDDGAGEAALQVQLGASLCCFGTVPILTE